MRTLLRDGAAGLMHSFIYFPFLILFAVTNLMIFNEQVPKEIKFLHGRNYQALSVTADVAGVLATIAQVFAQHDVSIQTVRQNGRGEDAQLVIVTHRATDAALSATVASLRELDTVRDVTSVMRVEGE